MIVKDWMREAVEEYENQDYATKQTLREIIAKHCPMKDGEVWMRVPRCETCRHWDNIGQPNQYHGFCRLTDHNSSALASIPPSTMTHANFGCVEWEEKTMLAKTVTPISLTP